MSQFKEPAQLHNHSVYSLMDALATPQEWLEWCLKTGTPAFSITDHGTAISLYDIVKFPKMIEDYNKKHKTNYAKDAVIGIPGIELYVKLSKDGKEHYHLNAWATSNQGYENLMKLSSLSFNDTVTYYGNIKGRVTLDTILEYREGLKFGTACIASPIGHSFMHGDMILAESRYKELLDTFGDDLYIEFHPLDFTHDFNKDTGGFDPLPKTPFNPDGNMQKAFNNFLLDMVNKYGGKPVPATDAHFINPDDKIVQDVILKNGNSNGWYFHSSCHQKQSQEIFDTLKRHLGDRLNEDMFKQWIENTYEVMNLAKNINIKFDYHLPKIDIPDHIKEKTDDYNMQTYYYLLDRIKANGRWNSSPLYMDRFKKEIDVIMKNDTLNFIPYFLLYEDISNFLIKNGVFQNIGRGSAGGSLLSYYLNIIHVDPIKADLPFERFLSHARIRAGSFPDIDMDIGDTARASVMQYLKDKYGLGFAQISTFNKIKTKNAIKDAMFAIYGRNRNDPEIKEVCESIPDSTQGVDEHDFLYGFTDQEENYNVGQIETNKILIKFFKRYPDIESMVKKLLGIPRGWSRHASAFVISTLDLSKRVPTMIMNDKSLGKIMVTQYNGPMVEKCGLVKADILGVKTLTSVSECINLVKKRHNIDLLEKDENGLPFIYRIPDDKEVFKDFYKKNTDSSFQFNTPLIKGLVQEFNPKSKGDLSIFTSLARPGSLDAPLFDTTATQYYLDVRNGKRKLEFLHEDLIPIIGHTNGVFCIAENQDVITDRGLINIQDIEEGDLVKTEDGSFQRVLLKTLNGYKDTVKVQASNGAELSCTPDHKLLTQRGWIEAQNLTKNDLIKSFWTKDECFEQGDLKDWLIGLMLADGAMTGSVIYVACSSKEFAEKVVDIAKEAFGLKEPYVKFNVRCWYAVLRHKKGNNGSFSKTYEANPIMTYARNLGLLGKNCYNKRLPIKISLNLLAGFIEGDGSLKTNRIRLCNKELSYDIFNALQAFRIPSSFKQTDVKVFEVAFHDYKNKLPFIIKKKKQKRNDSVYLPRSYLPKLSRTHKKRGHNRTKLKDIPISKRIIEELNLPIEHELWSKVDRVVKGSNSLVYDLTIENIHSFVVGGYVVHNCFQESIMKFLVDIVGYTLEESDQIRSAIAKKKHEVMMSSFSRIRESCRARGWADDKIETICQQVQAFSNYSFNLSHGYCYSFLGYITMYLKHYYPLEWWSSVLNSEKDEDKIRFFVSKLGNIIKTPSLKNPSMKFTISGSHIVAPLSVIKRVGENMRIEIVSKGPFTDIDDFLNRINHTKVNIAGIDALIRGRIIDDLLDPNMDYYAARLNFMDHYIKRRLAKNYKPVDPTKIPRKKSNATLKKENARFSEDLYKNDPISIFMIERAVNKSFNKTLLDNEDIVKLLANKWSGLKITNKKEIPLSIGRTPIICNCEVLSNLVDNGYDSEVGLIVIFEGSEVRSGKSKKTGKPWSMTSLTISDGLTEMNGVIWDSRKPINLPAGTLIYVRGIVKRGWKDILSIDIKELEEIND